MREGVVQRLEVSKSCVLCLFGFLHCNRIIKCLLTFRNIGEAAPLWNWTLASEMSLQITFFSPPFSILEKAKTIQAVRS